MDDKQGLSLKEDKNLNPAQPSTLNEPAVEQFSSPATPPASFRSFFVTEEEAGPPPPVAAGANVSPLPTLPSLQIGAVKASDEQKSKEEAYKEKKESAPSGGGFGSVLPPVITPPQKKTKLGVIVGIGAILILAISIPVGVVLLSKNQELRERAAVGEPCTDNPVSPPAGFKWTALCEQSCTTNDDCPAGDESRADRGAWCYGFEDGKHPRCLTLNRLPVEDTCTQDNPRQLCSVYACNVGSGDYVTGEGTCPDNKYCCRLDTSRLTPAPGGTTPAPGVTTPAPGTGSQQGTGGSGACARLDEAGALVQANDGKSLGDRDVAPCNIVASFVSQWGDKAGRRWAAERTCGNNIPAARDGQTIVDQSGTAVRAAISQWGANACERWKVEHTVDLTCGGVVPNACDGQNLRNQPTTAILEDFMGRFGANACTKWVEEHNASVNNCRGAGGAQCMPIIVYKYPYAGTDKLQSSAYGTLKPNDPVLFCVKGTGAENAQVRISNGSPRRVNRRGPDSEYCVQYDIPASATTLSVSGEVL